jgi:5-formyltetrahydrofolate cyclo-ligase
MNGAGAPGDPAARKRALRAQARRAGAGLAEGERARRSRQVEARVLALPELAAWRSVALYAPLRDEVRLEVLAQRLQERGCRLAYPRVDGLALALHWIGEGEELRSGPRGLLEPGPGAPLAPLDRLDAIVIPGLMFDRLGRRLGRGGGHYDRLLACLPASTRSFGLCLAEQLVAELPAEPHDLPVDWVVTDLEVLRIS